MAETDAGKGTGTNTTTPTSTTTTTPTPTVASRASTPGPPGPPTPPGPARTADPASTGPTAGPTGTGPTAATATTAAAGATTTATPKESAPPADRARKYTAWHAGSRLLSEAPETVGERLARLAADAPAAYDLADWTDMYGNDDSIVGALERRTSELLGTEDAAFFPTGTMAQQVALRCWAGRTGIATVAGHPLSHLEEHERDAYAVVSGVRMVHPTREGRLPTAAEVHDMDEPFGTLHLELPLRGADFVLPTWDELTAVVEAARERDAVVHMDGARLWECTTHFGRALPEIAALADTVYVSFYKALGGLSGAALAGPEDFVAEARAWRHRYGGTLFQQWPAALSALAGLDRELPRFPEYVAHARVVAQALREGFAHAGVPWFAVRPEVPHTHQFAVWLPYPAEALNEAGTRLAEETGTVLFRTWSDRQPPGLARTEVSVRSPGLDWTADDVRAAVAAFTHWLLPARDGTAT